MVWLPPGQVGRPLVTGVDHKILSGHQACLYGRKQVYVVSIWNIDSVKREILVEVHITYLIWSSE